MGKYTRGNWAASGQRRLSNLSFDNSCNKQLAYEPSREEVSAHIRELYRYDPDDLATPYNAEDLQDKNRDKLLEIIESLPPEARLLIDRDIVTGSNGVFLAENSTGSGNRTEDA